MTLEEKAKVRKRQVSKMALINIALVIGYLLSWIIFGKESYLYWALVFLVLGLMGFFLEYLMEITFKD